MSRREPKQAEGNVGAFLGPDMLVPTPIRTLEDEYDDQPSEPQDSDHEPEPASPGLIKGLLRLVVARGKRRRP